MPDYFNSLLTGHVLNVYIPIHSIMCFVLTLRTELSTYFILANFHSFAILLGKLEHNNTYLSANIRSVTVKM